MIECLHCHEWYRAGEPYNESECPCCGGVNRPTEFWNGALAWGEHVSREEERREMRKQETM